MFSKILHANDGSEPAFHALSMALAIAQQNIACEAIAGAPRPTVAVRIAFHAQPSRRMIARPIIQSLSSSDRNGSSSVKWVMRCW